MYRDRIRELTPWRLYKLPDLEPMSFPIEYQPYLYKSSDTRIVLVNLDPDFSELMGFRRVYVVILEGDGEPKTVSYLESVIDALVTWTG